MGGLTKPRPDRGRHDPQVMPRQEKLAEDAPGRARAISSDSRKPCADCNEQQPTQHAKTGNGSGSALEAMLRKRREGENHPDDEAPQEGEQEVAREK